MLSGSRRRSRCISSARSSSTVAAGGVADEDRAAAGHETGEERRERRAADGVDQQVERGRDAAVVETDALDVLAEQRIAAVAGIDRRGNPRAGRARELHRDRADRAARAR